MSFAKTSITKNGDGFTLTTKRGEKTLKKNLKHLYLFAKCGDPELSDLDVDSIVGAIAPFLKKGHYYSLIVDDFIPQRIKERHERKPRSHGGNCANSAATYIGYNSHYRYTSENEFQGMLKQCQRRISLNDVSGGDIGVVQSQDSSWSALHAFVVVIPQKIVFNKQNQSLETPYEFKRFKEVVKEWRVGTFGENSIQYFDCSMVKPQDFVTKILTLDEQREAKIIEEKIGHYLLSDPDQNQEAFDIKEAHDRLISYNKKFRPFIVKKVKETLEKNDAFKEAFIGTYLYIQGITPGDFYDLFQLFENDSRFEKQTLDLIQQANTDDKEIFDLFLDYNYIESLIQQIYKL